jgi:protein-disulfide reductase (glutathione)
VASRRRLAVAFALTVCVPACVEELPPGGGAAVAEADQPQPATPARAKPTPRTRVADAHGFNDAIAWQELDGGLALAREQGLPVMLVVHASWCPKCTALKPVFATAPVAALSESFVMVNVDQDLAPRVATDFAPDGDYVPRVVFLRPDGTTDAELRNPVRDRFAYFYMPHDDLAGAMERALARHGRS